MKMEASHSVKKKRTKRDVFASEESKIRYEAYSRLQAAAVAFGEHLPIPEIVAIGGQSDGKSSLLEAFLGFRQAPLPTNPLRGLIQCITHSLSLYFE